MQKQSGLFIALLIALVALVGVCACLVVGGAAGAGYLVASRPQPAPLPTLNPTQIVESMDSIEAFVITTRGLQPKAPVERQFLTTAQVRARTLADFEKDYSPAEAATDTHVLAAFGLVAPSLDLYDLLIRLYSEGVAGFYDPDTKELVLVSEAAGFNAYERTTFAHEYNHALQDQNYDIRGSGFSTEMADTDSQRFEAVQAVMEGDATLLEEQYQATLSAAERAEYDAAVNAIDVSLYYELPDFLLSDFLFPYQAGLEFVRHYYDAGGWARVDEVWRNLPVSSEQILHPARYDAGEAPIVVARPALTDTLGSGWQQLEADVNGEWYTYLILAHGLEPKARLDEAKARQAATGWGGDGYVVFAHTTTSQTVLAAEWVWDTPADAGEFAAAFKDYAAARFRTASTAGSDGRVCWAGTTLNCLFVNDTRTLWLMAPDEAILNSVLSQFSGYG